MESMFKLSRRKGSLKWQVRKRWPTDVASILKGEFNVSIGEEDKKRAQQRLPYISADYEKRVAEARATLAEQPPGELTDAEAHRMAADFYRRSLPQYVVRRKMDLLQHRQLLQDTHEALGTLKDMQARRDYGPVLMAARSMTKQAGLLLPDESPAFDHLQSLLMGAFIDRAALSHRVAVACGLLFHDGVHVASKLAHGTLGNVRLLVGGVLVLEVVLKLTRALLHDA